MKYKIRKINSSGFGLLEVIVPLGIIITVEVSILSLSASSIKLGTLSRQRTQATEIARQGLEVVRNIRDSNWASGVLWNNSFTTDDWYKIKFNDVSATNKYWELIKVVSPTPREETITIDGVNFTREIEIKNKTAKFDDTTDIDYADVKVIIKWGNTNTKKIEITEYLTNWK